MLEPGKVTDVRVADAPRELDLDREDPAIGTFDDQVDLALPSAGAQMTDGRLRRLGVDAEGERDQGFEQRAEKRPVPCDRRACRLRFDEAGRIRAQQSRCETRV